MLKHDLRQCRPASPSSIPATHFFTSNCKHAFSMVSMYRSIAAALSSSVKGRIWFAREDKPELAVSRVFDDERFPPRMFGLCQRHDILGDEVAFVRGQFRRKPSDALRKSATSFLTGRAFIMSPTAKRSQRYAFRLDLCLWGKYPGSMGVSPETWLSRTD